jgi:hypothetical protein
MHAAPPQARQSFVQQTADKGKIQTPDGILNQLGKLGSVWLSFPQLHYPLFNLCDLT